MSQPHSAANSKNKNSNSSSSAASLLVSPHTLRQQLPVSRVRSHGLTAPLRWPGGGGGDGAATATANQPHNLALLMALPMALPLLLPPLLLPALQLMLLVLLMLTLLVLLHCGGLWIRPWCSSRVDAAAGMTRVAHATRQSLPSPSPLSSRCGSDASAMCFNDIVIWLWTSHRVCVFGQSVEMSIDGKASLLLTFESHI